MGLKCSADQKQTKKGFKYAKYSILNAFKRIRQKNKTFYKIMKVGNLFISNLVKLEKEMSNLCIFQF